MTPHRRSGSLICNLIMSLCSVSFATINNFSNQIGAVIGDYSVRPRIDVEVNSSTQSWLYDSGAARTCMNLEVFRKMFPRGNPRPCKVSDPRRLRDASGNDMGLFGIFIMNLTILGKTNEHSVYVLRQVNDIILGADFIHKFNLDYNSVTRTHFWRKPAEAPILSVSEQTHFPALSTKVISSRFSGNFDQNVSHIATIFSSENKLLIGGPALITVSQNGQCAIAVTNCAPYDIYLDRGDVIG